MRELITIFITILVLEIAQNVYNVHQVRKEVVAINEQAGKKLVCTDHALFRGMYIIPCEE